MAGGKSAMPDVWNRFVELESEEGLAYSKWLSYGETLKERDGYIDRAFLL